MSKVKIVGNASGSGTLTITGPDTSSDRTITLPDATGTLLTEVADDAITLAKMASGTDGNIISYDASGNPVAVATGSAGQVLTSAGAGAPPTMAAGNTPAFAAQLTSYQSIAHDTNTKIQYDSEIFDSDGCYDNSTNYRFTPDVAGKYFVGVRGEAHDITDGTYMKILIYKNGSNTTHGYWHASHTQGVSGYVSGIYDMNGSSDYLEGFLSQHTGSTKNAFGSGTSANYFFAYRLLT
jgi:hypothetical protein